MGDTILTEKHERCNCCTDLQRTVIFARGYYLKITSLNSVLLLVELYYFSRVQIVSLMNAMFLN